METSSPLASLQPNHPGHFPRPTGFFPGTCKHESSSFNFKDMSVLRSRSDYFSFNPVRGSSPTTSLAADLSQNFHIDQSPQLPTPRRNLFSGTATSFGSSGNIITPPIPPSSPGPDVSMETSPLPHKPLSAGLYNPMRMGVPTPDPTPLEDNPMGPLVVPRADLLNIPRPQSARPTLTHHRRISNGTRPSLRKGFSATVLTARSNTSQQSLDPPFVFGSNVGSNPPPPPILESFADSPPSERKLPASSSTSCLLVGPPVLPKLLFPEAGSQNGSPVGPLRRMSATRVGGPRIGLSRRTQSMQYNNVRPMRQEKRCCTEGNWQPSIDFHETRALKLPHFQPDDEVDALPRITRDTLVEVMNGTHAADIGNVTIIDCRFEYEYEGGHIDGAVNFNDKEALASQLFPNTASTGETCPSQPQTLVFHCEYSNHRAPIMAKFIRQRDRYTNSHRYPLLTYPEMYILDGGYSSFFAEHRLRCFPQNYVEMDAKEHEDACERGMAKVKRRAKLSRAQTYAFGQSSGAIALSTSTANLGGVPTVPSVPELPSLDSSFLSRSPTSFDAMDLDMAFDDSPAPPPRQVRRNESY